MESEGRLMSMLTSYAAAHQHPFNIFVHMIGIPVIMLGVLIPLTWIGFEMNEYRILLAHVLLIGLFLFYLTLDAFFAVEKSVPVLVKHPIQANLAAPFFMVVELVKLAGLRDDLFNEVQRQVERQRRSGTLGSET
jgi:uncharacterized membrane protein YGL010W